MKSIHEVYEVVINTLKNTVIDLGYHVDDVEVDRLLEPYIKPDILIYLSKNDSKYVFVIEVANIRNLADLLFWIDRVIAAMKILEKHNYKVYGLVVNINSKFDKLSRMYIEERLKDKPIKAITIEELFRENFKAIMKELLT